MNLLKYSLLISVVLLFVSYIFSPYKNYSSIKNELRTSIVINTNPCRIFNYLGNSENASEWSSFVSHISPLKGKDGTLDSTRRCYKKADKNTWRWDEQILLIEECKKRKLSIFNLVNFPMSTDNLCTEQIYQEVGDDKCRLTFSLLFEKEESWFDFLRMKYSAFYIEDIFEKNLNNIKKIIENSNHAYRSK